MTDLLAYLIDFLESYGRNICKWKGKETMILFVKITFTANVPGYQKYLYKPWVLKT